MGQRSRNNNVNFQGLTPFHHFQRIIEIFPLNKRKLGIIIASHFVRFSMKKTLFTITILLISVLLNPSFSPGQTQKQPPKYVGSDACKSCHENEYNSFSQYAKKSRSFESIERVKKGLTEGEIKGCYFCHTTGYGKLGGFVSLEKTPHLKNAGCEVCHGPGEYHMRSTNRRDIKRRLTMKDCEACHISERVRAFRYKPMIHGGAH